MGTGGSQRLEPRRRRMSWDEYFMRMAHLVAKRSTCLRRQVGAVLVKDNRVLATGYNGAPKGLPHCVDLGKCLREELGICLLYTSPSPRDRG